MIIINIKYLVNTREVQAPLRGKALNQLPVLENAYLQLRDGRILDYGKMDDLPQSDLDTVFDAKGKSILPAWCDSHSHLVFAATRENEFLDKIKGLSYAEIAAKGGGILNSARKLSTASEDELFLQAQTRLKQLIALGTGALEIKSGYGLNVEAEIKMLRVIKRLKQWSPIPIKATFLGAHAFPEEFKDNREAYIDLIINQMLPQIQEENLADYIDVFCEKDFFTPEQTLKICQAGQKIGLIPKIHANQLHISGGVQVGYELKALSVDHLESIAEEEIHLLGKPDSPMATLLPTAAYFLRMPFPPARQLIENNAAVVIASDFNPGSSPSGNMNTVLSMSCIQMKMFPNEAINAATLNGAYAMQLEDQVGSITKGKLANLIVTKEIPNLAYLPYSFGENCIDSVIINGNFWN